MSELEKILNIEADLNLKHFKKGEFIQQPNQLKANAIIVKKGLIRSYIIDSTGKEHIYMFAPENWIIADGLNPKKPNELFIHYSALLAISALLTLMVFVSFNDIIRMVLFWK